MSSIGGFGRFFKQPALPSEAPPTKKKSEKNLKNKSHYLKITNESKVAQNIYYYILRVARPGTASGCLIKATETPNAGHPI
jgi:hypothetical protein